MRVSRIWFVPCLPHLALPTKKQTQQRRNQKKKEKKEKPKQIQRTFCPFTSRFLLSLSATGARGSCKPLLLARPCFASILLQSGVPQTLRCLWSCTSYGSRPRPAFPGFWLGGGRKRRTKTDTEPARLATDNNIRLRVLREAPAEVARVVEYVRSCCD